MAKIWDVLFASAGDKQAIPVPVEPDGSVSVTQGWTPDYELPNTDPSYKPVGREEMNGAFNEVTDSIQQLQLQGAAEWSSLLMPYPNGAEVIHSGQRWRSTAAGNSGEPGAGALWVISDAGIPIGSIIDHAGGAIPAGYVECPTSLQLFPTSNYPLLFAVIGYAWGGSGGNFALPYFPVGYVSGAGVPGTSDVGEVISHTHAATQPPHTHLAGGEVAVLTGGGASSALIASNVNTRATTSSQPAITVTPSGGTINRAAQMRVRKLVKYQ